MTEANQSTADQLKKYLEAIENYEAEKQEISEIKETEISNKISKSLRNKFNLNSSIGEVSREVGGEMI